MYPFNICPKCGTKDKVIQDFDTAVTRGKEDGKLYWMLCLECGHNWEHFEGKDLDNDDYAYVRRS